MYKILTTLLLTALLACSGSPKNTTPEVAPAPEVAPEPRFPWDSFTGEEAALYASCEMGTRLMQEAITSWHRPQLTDSANPKPMEELPGRYLDVRMGPIGEIAALQFKLREDGKAIYEVGFFQVPADPNGGVATGTLVDFYTLRDIYLGIIPPGETDPNVVFSSATGEYFCLTR